MHISPKLKVWKQNICISTWILRIKPDLCISAGFRPGARDKLANEWLQQTYSLYLSTLRVTFWIKLNLNGLHQLQFSTTQQLLPPGTRLVLSPRLLARPHPQLPARRKRWEYLRNQSLPRRSRQQGSNRLWGYLWHWLRKTQDRVWHLRRTWLQRLHARTARQSLRRGSKSS